MRVRKFKLSDKEVIEYIHFETGFFGNSMSDVLSNNKLWKGRIQYYFNKEPDSIFVLEREGEVLGYLLGCLDDNKKKVRVSAIIHNIVNFFRSIFHNKKDVIFWLNPIISFFNMMFGFSQEHKFSFPKNAGHFHISLLPDARCKKMGSALLKRFEEYARYHGVKIIHGDGYIISDKRKQGFWEKNGFKIYSKVKTSMWNTILKQENVYLVCFYKKLV